MNTDEHGFEPQRRGGNGQLVEPSLPGKERGGALGERLLTKLEVADRLQVDLRTVERWMAMGVLRPIRVFGVVRFIWEDVLTQLKERCEARGARCRAEGKQKVQNRNLKTGIGAEGKTVKAET